MKTRNSISTGILIVLVLGLIAGCVAHAQSAAAVNPSATFVNSVENYFTSLNTNFTFSGVKLEMSSGYKQVTGANAASELYAQYNLTDQMDVMGNLQFSGIGSAINAVEVGPGYALINHYDVKVQADLLIGWDSTKGDTSGQSGRGALVIEPRLALKKKLTLNTYAETAVSLPEYSIGKANTQPSFYIGVGFTY